MNKLKHYDIILAHFYSRVNPYNINIVKELSRNYKVGIYKLKAGELNHSTKQVNLKDTDQIVLDLASEYGGTILDNNKGYSCNLFLLTHHSFDLQQIKTIKYKNILLIAHIMYGSYYLKEYKQIGGRKICVFSKDMYKNVVKINNQEEIISGIEVVECDPPYTSYPAIDFSDLEIDYIIAFPSPIFLRNSYNRMKLLCNICRLIEKIPVDKNIYYKSHNITDIEIGIKHVNSGIKFIKILLYYILKSLYKILHFDRSVSFRIIYHNVQTLRYLRIIEMRATDLAEVTKYHNFNIEHFLPFVRKGLITGISTCILNALFSKIPVYNCDDQELSEETPNHHVIKNYYIPSCRGKLEFNDLNYERVKKNDNYSNTDQYNMIEILKNEII